VGERIADLDLEPVELMLDRSCFEVARLESRELEEKAADLRALADTYLVGR